MVKTSWLCTGSRFWLVISTSAQASEYRVNNMGTTAHPLVSFAILSYNRKEYLRKAIQSILHQSYEQIEIVVVDNNSSDGSEELFVAEFNQPTINFVQLSHNLGVSVGRNVAMGMAKGDLLIIIDDDAELIDTDATRLIVEKFAADPQIGALAFKITDYGTREIQKGYRINRNRTLNLDEEFENWGFRGAGHAMRKEVFEKVGPYPDYSPWGHEELDICLKILDARYKIIYFPRIEIIHHRTTAGRLKNAELRAISLENRIKVSLRNLPWRCVITTAFMWSCQILLVQTKFNVWAVYCAYQNLWSKRHTILKERRVIQEATLRRAEKLGAPLYY
jgi:GT2 family glycosyltransferase